MGQNIIIKSSHSKLPNGKLKSNYGDVIRSSVLLKCLDDDFIWITDKRSQEVLKWFINKKHIITFDEDISRYLCSDDVTIFNIDNLVSNSSLFSKLKGNWHGFIWDGGNDVFPENAKIADTAPYLNIKNKYSWQQALIEGMGFTWKRQDYVEISIHTKIVNDVGFNWHVDSEWKSKYWPRENWKKLESLLLEKYSVSWQKGLDDIDMYMHWLSSCKIIVTGDSFGLHLASALRKQVVVITGPTDSREYAYNRTIFIKPDDNAGCMPCNNSICKFGQTCLDKITPQEVNDIVVNILNKYSKL